MATVKPKHQHRIFLQSLLSRRTMLESTAIELYKRICVVLTQHEPTFRPVHSANQAGIIQFMSELSSIVEDIGLEVRRTRDESSKGRWWYTLINTEGTGEVALSATDLTPLELAYYRELITSILESYPGYSLGAIEARHVAGKLETPMNRAHADDVLDALVSRGWLMKSKRARYSLGTRALAELEPWFKAEYEDIVFQCASCMKIVTKGWACGNPEITCETHYHAACFAIQSSNPRAKCPNAECQLPLAELVMKPVGEGSVPKARDDDIGLFRKRRPGRTVGSEGEDEYDRENELEDTQTQSQSQSQSQPQLRKRQAGMESQIQAEDGDSDDDLYDEPPPEHVAKRKR